MRVVIWVEKFIPHIGGIERALMMLLPALQARGIMVACLPIVKQRAIPLITSLSNMERHPQEVYSPNAATGKMLLAAEWVTTVSQAILDQTIHYLPELKARISVLYSGYPMPSLEPAARAFVGERFTHHHHVDEHVALYRRIVSHNKQPVYQP